MLELNNISQETLLNLEKQWGGAIPGIQNKINRDIKRIDLKLARQEKDEDKEAALLQAIADAQGILNAIADTPENQEAIINATTAVNLAQQNYDDEVNGIGELNEIDEQFQRGELSFDQARLDQMQAQYDAIVEYLESMKT